MKNLKIKNSQAGITLVEIMVAIFIIAIFSVILVFDFPKIQRQFALSEAVYRLAQDLRKAEDLGLSGIQMGSNDMGSQLAQAKGYGVFIDVRNSNSAQPAHQYIIYADTCPPATPDYRYTAEGPSCSDYIIETVDISKEYPGVYIKELDSGDVKNIGAMSVNFAPPNPYINIADNLGNNYANFTIVLALISDQSAIRKVSVNTSGLIEIK